RAALDGDPARAGFLGIRQAQGQHPMLERRLSLIGLDVGRQRDRALEAPVAALAHQPGTAIAALLRALRLLVLLARLTTDLERVAGDLDGNVVGPHTRHGRL